jgi:hypothetical protein
MGAMARIRRFFSRRKAGNNPARQGVPPGDREIREGTRPDVTVSTNMKLQKAIALKDYAIQNNLFFLLIS